MTNIPLSPQTLVVYENTHTTRHLFLERASRRRNLITLEPRVWHRNVCLRSATPYNNMHADNASDASYPNITTRSAYYSALLLVQSMLMMLADNETYAPTSCNAKGTKGNVMKATSNAILKY